ncbi:MAG: DUF1015 domain-containing protein [Anaerolineales bacterium]|nr:DUF1015 domain-containing protein [Anaerolineales bacterium]
MKIIHDVGVQVPQVLLPRAGVDLNKWAVIACDQFTSQPEYWQAVEQIVGPAPSTLHLVLPEVYLEQPGEAERIRRIQATMQQYLDETILQPRDGLIYVERTFEGRTRRGIMLCLDLEHYDYTRGSTSLIRASEGTIVERLPPRMKIRRGAALELPHILVLIDDPSCTVVEQLAVARDRLEPLYAFDLMQGSGHLCGYAVSKALEAGVVAGLRGLARPEAFASKYGVPSDTPVLLFAMGDGNHSLATAKAVWEELKPTVGMDHPARYALVEIENVHDEGLEFEPIHRILFGLRKDILAALEASCGPVNYIPVPSAGMMVRRVDEQRGPAQLVGMIGGGSGRNYGVVEIVRPGSNLPVGTLQACLDSFLRDGGAEKIDYVHGSEVICELGAQEGNLGFYVPGMHKADLFKTVILDGALPRKTFSMGEAQEKRFYMEARKII